MMANPWTDQDMYRRDYPSAGSGFPEDADDPECGCGHPVSLHDGPAGECSAHLEYDLAPGAVIYPCVCRQYEGSV